MKNIIIIVLLLISRISLLAIPDSLNQTFQKANELYKKNNYTKAIDLYSSIINSGYESAELYYNLGNAYFRNNDIANARLYYEKALKIKPNDEDAKANIEFLKATGLVDNFDKVPVFFLDKWYHSLIKMFNANTWAIISLSTLIVGLVLFMVFLFSKYINRRKLSFIFSIIILFVSFISFFFSTKMKNNYTNPNDAVVMQITTIKSSPEEQGTDLVILHPGVKVEITKKEDNWCEVRLPNGKMGWLKIEELKII